MTFVPFLLGVVLPMIFLVGFGAGHYAFGRPAASETEASRG